MDAAIAAAGRPVIARADFERALATRDLLETLGNADAETIGEMAAQLQSLHTRRESAGNAHGLTTRLQRRTGELYLELVGLQDWIRDLLPDTGRVQCPRCDRTYSARGKNRLIRHFQNEHNRHGDGR